MPPQTRQTWVNPPAGRVYESHQLPEQVRFKPRRQKVYGRHSLGNVQRKKQETLTQIGFVNPLTDAEIEEEIEAYEREEKARSKRRKTLTPSSKFYTQTLTQFEFESTPKVECRDSEEEDEDEVDDEDEEEDEVKEEKELVGREADERTEHVSESPIPRRRPQRRGIITVRCIKVEPETSIFSTPRESSVASHEAAFPQNSTSKSTTAHVDTSMPPPKTPTHKRTLEVPSSQSPATPLSTQSISKGLRTYDERSPLKPRGTNTTSPFIPTSSGKFTLPRQSQISTQAITQDDPISLVPDSSPFRPHHTAPSTQSPSAQVLSEFTAASSPTPQRRRPTIKTEIADSDADSDDEIDSLPPTQLPRTMSVQVPSSPEVVSRRRPLVSSSSPLRRPTLAVRETVREESEGDDLDSQWTPSQLLPESLMMDSLLTVPPGLGCEWEEF